MRRYVFAVLGLHLIGWGLLWWYSRSYGALAGLGTLAYVFGLRHGFDADHIAAIDNTTRKLLQDGKRPRGVGFFFSLGHATVVFVLVAALALAAGSGAIPSLETYGAYVGPAVTGTFLWIVGILNLNVLVDLLRSSRHGSERLERRLADRGLVSRLFLRRIGSRIQASWHMYPLGVLFALSFDTASEIGLLALAARAADQAVPWPAVLSLPFLFAAGMSLIDTSVGGFMRQAYGWSLHDPARRRLYNLVVTSLSVALALFVGTVLLLQAGFGSGLWEPVLAPLGYGIVAASAATWAIAAIVWKTRLNTKEQT